MDFTLDETQQAVQEAAAAIFAGHATADRVREIEQGAEPFDRKLWAELARANLVGLAVPDELGGSGLGVLEACLLLEQQGRRVAPVPLLPTLIGSMALAEFGRPDADDQLRDVAAGRAVLAVAAGHVAAGVEPVVAAGGRLQGIAPVVAAGQLASRLIVTAEEGVGPALFAVDPSGAGVDVEPMSVTDGQPAARVSFRDAPAVRLAGAAGVSWIVDRLTVGLCALQVGVCEEAVAMTAAYTSSRHQFNKPLSTFQGVAIRAADAYIDTEAMRVTMLLAAWRLADGADHAWGAADVETAAFWAADAGHRVVHAAQHLHGGLGADTSYPIHRYFLWGKQIEMTLGGASRRLHALAGELVATR